MVLQLFLLVLPGLGAIMVRLLLFGQPSLLSKLTLFI